MAALVPLHPYTDTRMEKPDLTSTAQIGAPTLARKRKPISIPKVGISSASLSNGATISKVLFTNAHLHTVGLYMFTVES